MRGSIVILTAAMLALAGPAAANAAEGCMIGDAALCTAEPGCHWDVNKRGCYPGPLPAQDPCAAHEKKDVCNVSSLNCQWSDGANKCESKPK
ncbi:MAG TPA: hypothetical protein VNJ31_11780 [Methyloceanibacter sp.]|nr:hypothetical protein [Methyloceanibacter sp.]